MGGRFIHAYMAADCTHSLARKQLPLYVNHDKDPGRGYELPEGGGRVWRLAFENHTIQTVDLHSGLTFAHEAS